MMHDDEIQARVQARAKSSRISVKQAIPREIESSTKTFVVGPPRAGTTLIYSVVASGKILPECTFVSSLMKLFEETLRYSDDERFIYYCRNKANLAEIFRKPIYDFLYSAASVSNPQSPNRFIFKDPILTLYLDYFQLFFGSSFKVVFCVRDPRDVVASMLSVLKKKEADKPHDVLFNQAVQFIFPFFYKIYSLDHSPQIIDPKKVFFLKYEAIVFDDDKVFRELEDFLGFNVDRRGFIKTIEGKLDKSSDFYSSNYGEVKTTTSVGKFPHTLSLDEIANIELTFSYYLDRLDYPKYIHKEDGPKK